MQAAAASSPWSPARSPSRTHGTATAVAPSVSTMRTGPTVASYRTAVACTCLKNWEDVTPTRSAGVTSFELLLWLAWKQWLCGSQIAGSRRGGRRLYIVKVLIQLIYSSNSKVLKCACAESKNYFCKCYNNIFVAFMFTRLTSIMCNSLSWKCE